MENTFEKMKTCSWNDNTPEDSIEKRLQCLIKQQRSINLDTFLRRQQEKYEIEDKDIEELKQLLVDYNDLKEMNFIGTDMYANAVFFKHKVKYLYRCVGQDTDEDKILGDADIKYMKHTKTIFEECLKQIEPGGKGKLFSYTKCFGKMLYKYATLLYENQKIRIEIRKDSIVNAISEDSENWISIQKYTRECTKQDGRKGRLPYFAIDMSNARDNSVKCLKYWITDFLGEQEWNWNKDIMDPIGDAEVVCNFTNQSKCGNGNVQRMEFDRESFCMLLYKYFLKYAEKSGGEEWFKRFVVWTLDSLENIQDGKLKRYFDKIIKDSKCLDKENQVNTILGMIDWDNEIKYMSRRKGENQGKSNEPAHMEVYKGGNADEYTRQWKDILFSAVEGKYSYIDYSNSQ